MKKIMKENFPNLVKETNMQVQEAERVPNKMDAMRLTPRHIIIKMLKIKDKEMWGCGGVAPLQGQAGPWYLCRQKNIHGAVGMSGMPLFMGG